MWSFRPGMSWSCHEFNATCARSTRSRLSSSVAALAALGLSCVAFPAGATDYQLNPRLELAAGYDDNANLAVTGGNKISASDGLADVRVDLVASESNWQWRLTPEVRGTWYPSHSDLDSNGEFLNLSGQRTGERYTLGSGRIWFIAIAARELSADGEYRRRAWGSPSRAQRSSFPPASARTWVISIRVIHFP